VVEVRVVCALFVCFFGRLAFIIVFLCCLLLSSLSFALFIFSLFPFLVYFTYFFLLSIPSLSTRIDTVSRPEVIGDNRTWF